MNLRAAYSRGRRSGACRCCPDSDDETMEVPANNNFGRSALHPNIVSSQAFSEVQREQTAQQGSGSSRELCIDLPDINFSAAHFVAFRGFRERLHGHNYNVRIRMGSETLHNDGYVVDFGDVKKAARDLCGRLKECMLVPGLSDVLSLHRVQSQGGTAENIEIHCEDGAFFSFPLDDCAILPLVHVTAEELSQYIWNELVGHNKEFGEKLVKRGVQWLEVHVEERPGQGSAFRDKLTSSTLMDARANLDAANIQGAYTHSVSRAGRHSGSAVERVSVNTRRVAGSASSNPVAAVPASPESSTTDWIQDELVVRSNNPKDVAEAAYSSLLSTLGPVEAARIGKKTAARAAKAFFELTSGLAVESPVELVRGGVFDLDGEGELVAVRDIQFHSLCEHHLLPFSGTAHVAYIPDKKILGLSKFARLLDAYARRPQVQEALSQQFMKALVELLQPRAVVVALEARHSCMSIRGVKQPGALTRTTIFGGTLKDDVPTRQMMLQNLAVSRSCL